MNQQLICQLFVISICFVLVRLDPLVIAEETELSPGVYDIDQFPDAKLRFNFLKAKPGVEKGKAARLLFLERSAEDVNYLCYDKDDSIAFCAAWQRLKMQMNAKLVGIDSGAIEIPIPQKLTREFIGFVEGRLRVPVPDAWAHNVLSAKYFFQGYPLFGMKYLPYKQYQNEKRFTLPYVSFGKIQNNEILVSFTGGYEREEDDNIFEGVEANAKLPLEMKLDLKGKLKDPELIYATGIASHGRAVIVLKDGGPICPKLMCIATDDSKEHPKLFWKIPLDSYWLPGFKGSQWFTEFRVRNNLLYLFHCTHDSIGVECISFKDGSRIFSFNSRWTE